jgi:hypothetical protein
MKYAINETDAYSKDFEKSKVTNWKELDIEENDGNQNSLTFFCGGTISSLDWAPSDSDINYLAIACNNPTNKKIMKLTGTSKSYIQVNAFESLLNNGYENLYLKNL